MSTLRTVLAHNQDINGLDVSGDFLATASQDKTCKVNLDCLFQALSIPP